MAGRSKSQAAGREVPAGWEGKIIFPVRKVSCGNELPRVLWDLQPGDVQNLAGQGPEQPNQILVLALV